MINAFFDKDDFNTNYVTYLDDQIKIDLESDRIKKVDAKIALSTLDL